MCSCLYTLSPCYSTVLCLMPSTSLVCQMLHLQHSCVAQMVGYNTDGSYSPSLWSPCCQLLHLRYTQCIPRPVLSRICHLHAVPFWQVLLRQVVFQSLPTYLLAVPFCQMLQKRYVLISTHHLLAVPLCQLLRQKHVLISTRQLLAVPFCWMLQQRCDLISLPIITLLSCSVKC